MTPGLMEQTGSILFPNLRMVSSSSPCLIRTRSRRMVLIAVAVSSAMAKCSKPFTSFVLYNRRRFEFHDAFWPAGFPSTHSSAAVVAAMTLGFERGMSDSIFGAALVFAGLIMYDAQGVKRQVGNHAAVINKALLSGDPLKESVGHTKFEVIGGAVLGFVVSVAIALVSSLVHFVI